MEVLRGCSEVADLDIVLRTELQKPAQVTVRMLGALSFITVGKEHDQTVSPVPFGLTRGDKLIDDHLGSVGKITKLGFPQRKQHRIGHRVAVLKGKDRKLG